MLAIDVINRRSGPGDETVTADAYVVEEGVEAARKALVSCFFARVRKAWYVREGSSRIGSGRTCGTRPASNVAMSDVCHACSFGFGEEARVCWGYTQSVSVDGFTTALL